MDIETEEFGDEDEDEPDFWGREGPRTSTSADVDADMEDREGSEEGSTSAMDECNDEESDEEDRFELLGHR